MEADRPANTKTRERTEGAATAVQAMRGDSCTTAQKVQDGPMTNSTCFSMMAELPALPCRDDVVVESGDATPESRLPSLEMSSSTAASGLVPTGETSTATETTVNMPLLQSYSTRRRQIYGLQLHTSRTTAVPSMIVTCLLLPTAGGSLRQNSGKIGLLIQAVRKVASAPAHFWDRGARWFVVRLYVLKQPGEELQQFLRGSIVRNSKVFRRAVRAKFYAVRIALFRGRFTDSLKQGQPRIRCVGNKSCRRGWLEAI